MTKTPDLNHPDTLVANCAGCDAQLPCGTVQYPKPWPHRIKGRPYCPTCVQASQLKLSPFSDPTRRSPGQALKLGQTRS